MPGPDDALSEKKFDCDKMTPKLTFTCKGVPFALEPLRIDTTSLYTLHWMPPTTYSRSKACPVDVAVVDNAGLYVRRFGNAEPICGPATARFDDPVSTTSRTDWGGVPMSTLMWYAAEGQP